MGNLIHPDFAMYHDNLEFEVLFLCINMEILLLVWTNDGEFQKFLIQEVRMDSIFGHANFSFNEFPACVNEYLFWLGKNWGILFPW